jgi:hypothetical protein
VDVVDGLGPSWSDSSTAACQPCSNRNKYFSEAETFRTIWMAMVGSINELSSDGSLLAPDIFGELFAANAGYWKVNILI